MNRNFRAALKGIADIVFTSRCEFCGEVIEIGGRICENCEKLPVNALPVCEFCGVDKSKCTCDGKKLEFKSIAAPYIYSDSVVTAINNFKSSNMPFLSKRFSADIAECVKERFENIDFDLITYVPITKRTYIKRSYNQAELLANGVSDILGIEVADMLVKTEETKQQKLCSEKERKVNVFGVFDLKDKKYVQGKTILLIDDVKTSGATLSECAKMLKIYGAKAVYAATIAAVSRK